MLTAKSPAPACARVAALGRVSRKSSRPAPRSGVAAPALPAHVADMVIQIADGAPGTVDAPIGVIIGAAIVVTAGSLLLSLGLKGGEKRRGCAATAERHWRPQPPCRLPAHAPKALSVPAHAGTDAAIDMQDRDSKSGRWRK